MNSRLPIICIMGSTCTGKTKLAIHLEKKFPLEIIIKDQNHNFKQTLNVEMKNQSLSLGINKTFFYYNFISFIMCKKIYNHFQKILD